jgi:hypothetical protein
MSVKYWVRQNGLSIALLGIFIAAIVGMSFAGWGHANEQLLQHGQASQTYGAYVVSGGFVEAVFENWESEFLQMWALVIFTVFLYQKGSIDSKPLRGDAPQDTSSRLSIIHSSSWKKRKRAIRHAFYAHSLGLALLVLFLGSFAAHLFGGAAAFNEEALQHGEQTITVWDYLFSSTFWFESLQNWQSEFLAVGVLLVLSIYLRERGSQQSKPVGKAYDHTTG